MTRKVQTHQKAHTDAPDPLLPREHDPNVRQRIAADPENSAWVSASAGTGKTKVLTDRVLRLLLPRQDGRPGAPAHKILCLTFTKAGAGEMALRINNTLAHWAVAPQQDLDMALRDLLGQPPTPGEAAAARMLFAEVVDTPGGLKIMTLHSFCQSVLGRFPLEAGLHPHFKVLDEGQALALLQQACDETVAALLQEKSSPLQSAFFTIAKTVNENQFMEIMRSIAAERHQLAQILTAHFGLDGAYTALCKALGIKPGHNPQDVLLEGCSDRAFDREGLKNAAAILIAAKGKKDMARGNALQTWLQQNPSERAADFAAYRAHFLNKNGETQANLAGKALCDAYPDIAAILESEASRLQALLDKMQAADCAVLTHALLRLGHEIIKCYQRIKEGKSVLDYDDLVFTTLDLLKGRIKGRPAEGAGSWVLYKLDRGIDHLLIDEAQDTNPEQWQIIETLCDEFFSGINADSAQTRTLFSVGDQKQSIYSFQRASPAAFAHMKDFLSRKISAAGRRFEDVPMNISFRSAASILRAVDAVFAAQQMRAGLGPDEVQHHSFRTLAEGAAGRVELWPLVETEKLPEIDPWTPPVKVKEGTSGPAQLAANLARTIRGWLDSGEELPARGRNIQPGDILILLRTRGAFAGQIARALKSAGIPVGGVDRMILGEELVVRDLLAFAEFALLPADDLTLACILKSPQIGLDEDGLFDLAAGRKGTLWDALQKSPHTDIFVYLQHVIRQARTAHPFEFFNFLLHHPCPADKQSGLRAIRQRFGSDAIDLIDEFIDAVLRFEKAQIPSLQHFLHWQAREHIEIKREMAEAGGFVRIMTVHGAKGLQAPVVILPDTTRTSTHTPGRSDKRLLWPDKTGLSLPLWTPRKDDECRFYRHAMARLDERLEEEYRRLLYVAMTRAEDRLYVTGYKTLREPLESSWYFAIQAGLERLAEVERLPCGTLRLENVQTRDITMAHKEPPPETTAETLPLWLSRHAPAEPHPSTTRLLTPSRPEIAEPAVTTPLQTADNYRFRRGNLTHKLLQILPAIAPDKRKEAARHFTEHFGRDLPTGTRTSIVLETLKILEDSVFAPLFGPGSAAEVPVTGLTEDGEVVSGQIDRMLVTEKAIWIIDYKTNRPPPRDAKDVPKAYRAQLRSYAQTLAGIYPGRAIHTALLWTDGPMLMPIETKDV
jgi:ATP-dependent helicase/nuclease subunit A